VDAFAKQISSMADAFLQWSLKSGDDGLAYLYESPPDAVVQERRKILVVDIFCACYTRPYYHFFAILLILLFFCSCIP
jgi:hypothetical protein